MKNWIKWLITRRRLRNPHLPLINIKISRSALLNNLNKFRDSVPNMMIAPVLKANAYGHGLDLIADILKDETIPFFVVDSYFEARALRNGDIKTPILVIGYSSINSIIQNKLRNVGFAISSIDALKELSRKAQQKISIHLKIDTGMNRQGILFDEIIEAIEIIKSNRNINLDGICSHLADADNTDKTFTMKQITIWNNCVEHFKRQFPNLRYWHISNTNGYAYSEAQANVVRLGIGLYGLVNIEKIDLEPVLEMKTVISSVKKIKKGDVIGYGCTFTATENMTIATLPLGYFEGVDRRLSNKGFVKINNIFCPILGIVSMNITVIDVSKIQDIKQNDEVIVISNQKNDLNSIENIAKTCHTITYEIAIHIPIHLKRIIY